MRKLSLLAAASLLALAACAGGAANTGVAIATNLDPVVQATVTAVSNLNPGVASVVANINSGIAATATDKAIACEAVGWAPAIASLAGLGQNSTSQALTKAAASLCNSPTTDIQSVVAAAANAYVAAVSTAKAAGAPVAAAPAAAAS